MSRRTPSVLAVLTTLSAFTAPAHAGTIEYVGYACGHELVATAPARGGTVLYEADLTLGEWVAHDAPPYPQAPNVAERVRITYHCVIATSPALVPPGRSGHDGVASAHVVGETIVGGTARVSYRVGRTSAVYVCTAVEMAAGTVRETWLYDADNDAGNGPTCELVHRGR